MSTSAIMDLLLKIISMEESPEGKGTVQVGSMAMISWSLDMMNSKTNPCPPRTLPIASLIVVERAGPHALAGESSGSKF
jgi:hypothetical protein